MGALFCVCLRQGESPSYVRQWDIWLKGEGVGQSIEECIAAFAQNLRDLYLQSPPILP